MAQTALGQLSTLSSGSSSSSSSSSGVSTVSSGSRASAADAELAHVPDQVRVPFEKHGNDCMVTVMVNGRPAQFVLDTGAGDVAIGRNHLKEWGISSEIGKDTYNIGGVGDGKALGWNMKLDLQLGQVMRKGFICGIQENMPTDPLLGQTFLRAFNVKIDDATRTVILAKKGGMGARDIAQRSYHSKEVPFEREPGGHMLVHAVVNGKPFPMLFDTGASSTCFSQSDWQRLGFSIPETARPVISRGVLGDANSWAFNIDSLRLGGIEQHDVPILVIENSKAPPLLGMSFYGKLQYTIDTTRNVIIFTDNQ
jgi:clan AA aspartic protease (TIGR02281 family)